MVAMSRGDVSTGATGALAPVNLRQCLFTPIDLRKKCLKSPKNYGLRSSFWRKIGLWHPWIKNPIDAPDECT